MATGAFMDSCFFNYWVGQPIATIGVVGATFTAGPLATSVAWLGYGMQSRQTYTACS